MSRFAAALLFAGLVLCGCGTKGPLSLPPGSPPEPVLGTAKARPVAEVDATTDNKTPPLPR